MGGAGFGGVFGVKYNKDFLKQQEGKSLADAITGKRNKGGLEKDRLED